MYNKITYNKLYSYFISRLGVRDYRKGWLKGNCPECGRDDKFGINLYKDKTNCFVCGYHPRPIFLVMDLENVRTRSEVLEIIGTYKEREYLEPIIEKLEKVNLDLPDGYINIALGDNRYSDLARSYVEGRGFEVEDVAIKGWGYCRKGEHFGYIIMPFYMGGKLVYYNARRFVGGGSKYKNPTTDESGLGKSMIIYNSDALAIYDEIYMAEGLINAETIGSQGIAMGGKSVSEYQLSMIKKSPIKSIVMLLDPDAISESVKLAMDLVWYKKIKLVYWEGKSDVNKLGKEKVMKYINKTDYSTYQSLLKFKNRLDEKRPIITY